MRMTFLRHFINVEGDKGIGALNTALINLDPDSGIQADLRVMEEDLDNAGKVIAQLRSDLAGEHREYDAVNKQYAELMSAAELIQKEVDDQATPEAKRGEKRASLGRLVARIEKMAPDLDRFKAEMDTTQTQLTDAEAIYQEKAQGLADAKRNLESAKHDLSHAKMSEQRSQKRAEDAAVVAGLRASNSASLNTALNIMRKSADEARQRAEASDMKASALKGAADAGEDKNVAEALGKVRGEQSTESLGDRLAKLRR